MSSTWPKWFYIWYLFSHSTLPTLWPFILYFIGPDGRSYTAEINVSNTLWPVLYINNWKCTSIPILSAKHDNVRLIAWLLWLELCLALFFQSLVVSTFSLLSALDGWRKKEMNQLLQGHGTWFLTCVTLFNDARFILCGRMTQNDAKSTNWLK